MNLTDAQVSYLEKHQSAAMITQSRDGIPRVARVSVGLVEGKLWSSGTHDRVRTARLRRDSRCTLFVFDAGWSWLSLETTVTLLEGPDVPELTVRLFRQMQNRPTGPINWFGKEMSEAEFVSAMAAEKRLIYEFNITRGYGMV